MLQLMWIHILIEKMYGKMVFNLIYFILSFYNTCLWGFQLYISRVKLNKSLVNEFIAHITFVEYNPLSIVKLGGRLVICGIFSRIIEYWNT